jgi:hypothetical protein
MRYIVKKNGSIVGTIGSLYDLKELVEFSRQHWYHQEVDGKMTYKRDNYEVVDVVDLFYKLCPNYLTNS